MMLVYRYGLLPPSENSELVFDQLRKVHAYRNVLTEIERGRRIALGAATGAEVEDATSDYKKKTEALVALRHKLRLLRCEGRSRRVEADALKIEIDEKKRDKIETLRALRTIRTESFRLLTAERDRIEELALTLRKGAREVCGVYWGTYLLCEDADLAARKAPLFDCDKVHLPHFQKWNGEGQLGVQVQGGMNVEELEDEAGTLIQVVPRRESTEFGIWDSERSPWGKTLRMRVGSTDRRARPNRGAHRRARVLDHAARVSPTQRSKRL